MFGDYGMIVRVTIPHVADHPSGCKWLIDMVHKSPKHWVLSLPNGLNGL